MCVCVFGAEISPYTFVMSLLGRKREKFSQSRGQMRRQDPFYDSAPDGRDRFA